MGMPAQWLPTLCASLIPLTVASLQPSPAGAQPSASPYRVQQASQTTDAGQEANNPSKTKVERHPLPPVPPELLRSVPVYRYEGILYPRKPRPAKPTNPPEPAGDNQPPLLQGLVH